MKFDAFKEKIKKYPFFRSNIFNHLTQDVLVLRRQISEWASKGFIIQLKRGMYILPEDQRVAEVSVYYLANNLYSPSYVSLESALSYYGFIPERVHAITSISSKKTQKFTNTMGNFIYHHLKPELYDDFAVEKDEFNNPFFIATPERAIIDFLYFKTRGLKSVNKDIFEESFRLQNIDTLNTKKLKTLVKKFKNKKLTHLVEMLIIQNR